MPVHESNQVRSAQRARSYEGSASVANPTAARRSWPRGSRTGYSITWSTLRGMEGMAFHSSFNDRYSPRHEGSVNLGAGDTAVREGDSIAVSTQGLQITRFSRSARTSSALKPARLVNTASVCSPMSGARVGENGESERRTGQPITENRPRVGWSML